MLIELRIRDYAVIQDLALELGPGLNALTGETGAGKSIIVGALSLLLGERASSDAVRTGADRAAVEAVFDLSGRDDLKARLDELGHAAEDDLLILRREVQAEGRNRAWINGSPATAGTVGDFGRVLVDLHGQHEHQTLLRPDAQRSILDDFAGAREAAQAVAELHGELAALRSEGEEKAERRRELEARADFLRFQLGEIQEAELAADEDRAVDEELKRLEHAEELARDAEAVHQLLYAEEGSASERLARARELLRNLARFDPGLEELRDRVEEVYHLATEAGRSAGDYASGVEVDPGRTEELRGRADLLFRLKRKYGPELADVLATRDRLGAELDELEGAEIVMEELEGAILRTHERLRERARELTGLRSGAAERLSGDVQELLPELGMPGARFQVALEPLEEVGAAGAERVRFLASLNPGFELQALSRIASGGELSRVMLALKSILARVDRVPSLVFDEIDAGIGGGVAGAVARQLGKVAEHHQVFVITHLPQLASRGHVHLRVEKGEREGIAATTVTALTGEDRIREIARMLDGDPESETSRDHARELLGTG
jgi:DNA repair protein RecN (Recombination protein N)